VRAETRANETELATACWVADGLFGLERYTLATPVRTRYVRLHVTELPSKNTRNNARISPASLIIKGCDPDVGKSLVPSLKGEADPAYVFGGFGPVNAKDKYKYPFHEYVKTSGNMPSKWSTFA